jgi:hypothetical protein
MVWTGATYLSGHGTIRVPNGFIFPGSSDHASTHRVAWYLAHGWVPPLLAHHCDRPACCNVEHRYAATPKDNAADAKARRDGTRAERIAAVLARAS